MGGRDCCVCDGTTDRETTTGQPACACVVVGVVRDLRPPSFTPFSSLPCIPPGLFPVDADQFELLRDSLGKLKLNDAAISFEVRPRPPTHYLTHSLRHSGTYWGRARFPCQERKGCMIEGGAPTIPRIHNPIPSSLQRLTE